MAHRKGIAALRAASSAAAGGRHRASRRQLSQLKPDYADHRLRAGLARSDGGDRARPVQEGVAVKLNTPIIIENKAGAGEAISARRELMRARPDGYTLMYGTSSVDDAPPLFDREDLDPRKAFVAASCSVNVPLILLAPAKMNIATAEDFYTAVKANPGTYFMGSSGNGSIDHLVGMDIANRLDLKFQHVPYREQWPGADRPGRRQYQLHVFRLVQQRPALHSERTGQAACRYLRQAFAGPAAGTTLSESVKGLRGFRRGHMADTGRAQGNAGADPEEAGRRPQSALKDPEVMKKPAIPGRGAHGQEPGAMPGVYRQRIRTLVHDHQAAGAEGN